jgi:protein-S-isoprenylcysteine O-methyltransferase Ste14
MNADTAFQPFVIASFVVILLIALPYRIRSQAAGEKLDRTQEGVFMLVTLRLAGAVLWVGVIAYMINPRSMAWSSMPLPIWSRWAGVALSALSAGLLLWTLRSLGKNLTDTVVTRRAHTLVTRGPYRWVRHPFYDCMALVALSAGLMAANWFVLVSGVAVFSLLAARTATEEAKLLERFGDPYRAYRMRTGRFLPRRGATE